MLATGMVTIIVRQLTEEFETCGDQHWQDAGEANCYNDAECASPFYFMLNGGNSLAVVLFSDFFPVLVGHKENVAVQAKDDRQRDDQL